MNGRLEHALHHPISGGETSIEAYRAIDLQPDGNLLVIILAVDR